MNHSGVTGKAVLLLDGDRLTVKIEAYGLTPLKPHPQHIHGFVENNRNAVCPPASADQDGDGLVEVGEGAPFYGPILLPLTPFPVATEQGYISYTETFTITKDLRPLQNRVIVLHGKMVGDQYVPTLPVACGQIRVKNNGKK